MLGLTRLRAGVATLAMAALSFGAAGAVGASGVLAGAAAGATGAVARVSVDYQTGGDSNNTATREVISGDGRYVCFESNATDLVAGEVHTHVWDIFRADLATGQIQRVSVDATTGADDNGSSHYCAMSSDGNEVAFNSAATDLVVGMTTSGNQVFVRNMTTGVTALVSWAETGKRGGNGLSERATMCSDGSVIAFNSQATNLVPGDTHAGDVYVRNLTTGATTDLSVAPGGGAANAPSLHPVISADCTHVAYETTATNLVPNDTSTSTQIVESTISTGANVLVTPDVVTGAADNGRNTRPAVNASGQFVAFESTATDLVTAAVPGHGITEVYERDTVNGTTALVSVDANGVPLTGPSSRASLDAAGDVVVFESTAHGVVAHLQTPRRQVYMRDVTTGVNSLVSMDATGGAGSCPAAAPSTARTHDGTVGHARAAPGAIASRGEIDAAGNEVAFISNYCDLVAQPTTTPPHVDVYVWSAG